MKQQKDLNSQHIAIWVGDIDDEVDLEDYLDESFPEEYGFEIDTYGQGPSYEVGDKQKIDELLTGFMMDSVFIPKCVDAAKALGIEAACSALVFHWVKYDPSLQLVPTANAEFKFLCNVEIPAD